MNLTWKIVPHIKLLDCEKKEIAELKNMHWSYGIDSQMNWMNDNIKDFDLHLMGSNEKQKLVAYMTIVRLSVSFDGGKEDALGVGGVCVNKNIEHRGYGRCLVQEANNFISQEGLKGLLLCKDGLVDFYKKCGWQNVVFSEAYVADKPFSYRIMAYPNLIGCQSVLIDRNF